MQVVQWYDELLALTGSPVVRLNRAVAVGEADGARAGLAALAEVDPALPRHRAVAAYLHEKDGDLVTAARLYAEAAGAGDEPRRADPPDQAGGPPQQPRSARVGHGQASHSKPTGIGGRMLPMQQLTRPDGSPVRVLVVDDEVNIAELLAMALRYEGWDLQMAHTGTDAVATARDFRPDAVVLDIMLPDFDGLEVLRRMRADGSDVPVLFLTAKDAVEDRIAGLTAGGDDYVTKPFSLEEVVARLRGLIRRGGTAALAEAGNVLVVGDLTLDEDSHEVHRGGRRDQPDRDRVRAAALPDAQPAPRAEQGADPRPGLAVRLRRPGQRRRALHLLPPQEGRRRPRADDPHHAGRGLRAEAGVVTPALRTLTARLVAVAVLLVALPALLIGTATTLAMRRTSTGRLDADVRRRWRARPPGPPRGDRTATASTSARAALGTLRR